MLSQTNSICSSVASERIAIIIFDPPLYSMVRGAWCVMVGHCHAPRITYHVSRITSRIAAEHADALDHLAEVRQRAFDARLVLVAGQIEVKRILPRAAFDGPRFDLGQINVAQRKDCQRAKQRTRLVGDAKQK